MEICIILLIGLAQLHENEDGTKCPLWKYRGNIFLNSCYRDRWYYYIRKRPSRCNIVLVQTASHPTDCNKDKLHDPILRNVVNGCLQESKRQVYDCDLVKSQDDFANPKTNLDVDTKKGS